MAKFCATCGAPLDDAAKFCPGCGTQQAQTQQPAPVQAQQPYTPQYQQAYAPVPAAPPAPPQRKKRKGLVVLGALGSIVLLIVVIAASALSKAGGADYYKVKDDQVPSINYVLQEKRKVVKSGTSINNGITVVYREYASSTPRQDIDTYFDYLAEKAGWIPVYGANMEFAGVGRNSVTPGYQLEIQAEQAAAGYTISVYYLKGQLEMLNNAESGGDNPTNETSARANAIGEEWWADALLGQWQDMDFVGSGYSERWLFQSDGSFAHVPSQMSEELNRELCEHGTWQLDGNRLQLTVEHRIMLVGGTVEDSEEGQYIDGADIQRQPVMPPETKTLTIGGFGNAEYYDGEEFILARETMVLDGVTWYEFSNQPDMFEVYFEYADQP